MGDLGQDKKAGTSEGRDGRISSKRAWLEQEQAHQAAVAEGLPRADWLASDPMEVDPQDPAFAPPALTNQWTGIVMGRDFFSYAGFAAPPIYADGRQAETFVGIDGARLVPGTEVKPVTYTWYPSRVIRRAEWQGLKTETATALSVRGNVLLQCLHVTNLSPRSRKFNLILRLRPDVRTQWQAPWPPRDWAHATTDWDPDRRCLSFVERDGQSCGCVETSLPPQAVAAFAADDPRWERALASGRLDGEMPATAHFVALQYQARLAPSERWELCWVHGLAGSPGEARYLCEDHMDHFGARFREVDLEWQKEWETAFTPGNSRFSGYLPVLRTSRQAAKRLYYMGVLNLLYAKRTRAWGQPAWLYATGFPSSAETFAVTSSFLWDAMMVSGMLAMLDPEALRRMIEDWITAGIHQGYGLDFLTGKPLGFWYGVNDHALIHMAYQYIRYTGDRAWLQRRVAGQTVLHHLHTSALYWQRISGEDGLADYGGPENLLECVSTYTHKVPSFNAANVWNLRTVARLWDLEGRADQSAALRSRADALVQAVQTLYVKGRGYWACKQPDGTLVPVRHCLDFITVMQCMGEDLRPEQREEMVQFFLRELQTPTWMHALSPLDPDAVSSVRPDHQDEGAYTTWPAYSLEVLLQTGHVAEALQWIGTDGRPGLADVTRQGPFGQAYYHGGAGSPTLCGAGAKAPMEPPDIEKPVLISGGKYAQVILETLAGVQPQLEGGVILATPALPFSLEFHNIPIQGRNFHFVAREAK